LAIDDLVTGLPKSECASRRVMRSRSLAADWLRKNKLAQYADAFEANDIDLDILPELTELDLEQLGVTLGNRRRLLKAITARTEASDETASQVTQVSSGDPERRQVTVMFCDLLSSAIACHRFHPRISSCKTATTARTSVPMAANQSAMTSEQLIRFRVKACAIST
jgi:hypothetical protein